MVRDVAGKSFFVVRSIAELHPTANQNTVAMHNRTTRTFERSFNLFSDQNDLLCIVGALLFTRGREECIDGDVLEGD
jgi:hypothetical protein